MRTLTTLLFAALTAVTLGCPAGPTGSLDAGVADAATADLADAGAADVGAADAGGATDAASSPDVGSPPDASGPADAGAVAPDPACTANGCLRSVQAAGDYTKAQLAPYLQAGVVIDTGYSVYKVEYVTGDRTSLATVTVPYPATAPTGGFHVAANAHGTSGLDDPCALTGTL